MYDIKFNLVKEFVHLYNTSLQTKRLMGKRTIKVIVAEPPASVCSDLPPVLTQNSIFGTYHIERHIFEEGFNGDPLHIIGSSITLVTWANRSQVSRVIGNNFTLVP